MILALLRWQADWTQFSAATTAQIEKLTNIYSELSSSFFDSTTSLQRNLITNDFCNLCN